MHRSRLDKISHCFLSNQCVLWLYSLSGYVGGLASTIEAYAVDWVGKTSRKTRPRILSNSNNIFIIDSCQASNEQRRASRSCCDA
jgi:hypothetical protein